MEQNLRRALSITNGELHVLYNSNISKGLWITSIFIVFVPPLLRYLKKKKAAKLAVGSAAS
jgi:putative tricarboxylic transport membrane protein